MHYEQRWLDLVPAYFDDVSVIRDPGANIGHWNLPERLSDERRLFRFSGLDPDRPDRVTVYSERLSMDDLDDAEGFIRWAASAGLAEHCIPAAFLGD